MKVDSIQTALVEEGWFVTPPAVLSSVVDELISEFESEGNSCLRRGGVRGLLARDSIRRLISNETIRMIVEADLGAQAFACRSILFDKTPEANWKVTWHQDLTIAVSERVEQEGFGPWSVKDGTPHVLHRRPRQHRRVQAPSAPSVLASDTTKAPPRRSH